MDGEGREPDGVMITFEEEGRERVGVTLHLAGEMSE